MKSPKRWGLGLLVLFLLIPISVSAPYQNQVREGLWLIEGNSLKATNCPWYPKPKVLGTRIVTAYSSSIDETDNTPYITASGQRVREGIVASNELEFGVLIEIDGVIYEVQDKMADRYYYRIDIWKPTKEEAKEFGKQIKLITILE